jgi:hypothetical protein
MSISLRLSRWSRPPTRLCLGTKDVDARHKAGHDDQGYRLICAFSVSSTTRSNDEAFGGALARWSATYLSRLATSADSS